MRRQDVQAKKTGPKAGFFMPSWPITWRERERVQPEQRQRVQRQEPEQPYQQQERQEQQEREQQLQQQERERLQERLLSCHKQTGTGPTERRAGRYISFLSFLESLSNMLIASVFRG